MRTTAIERMSGINWIAIIIGQARVAMDLDLLRLHGMTIHTEGLHVGRIKEECGVTIMWHHVVTVEAGRVLDPTA